MKPKMLKLDLEERFNDWRAKTVVEINKKNDREALKSLLYAVLFLEERVKELEGGKG